MRAKFFSIFFITFVLFVAAIVWRVDQILFADKLSWSEAQARSQMSALVLAVQSDLKSLKYMMSVNGNDAVDEGNGRFAMVARVTPATAPGGEWQLGEVSYREKNSVKAWAPTYIGLTLKAIKAGDVRDGAAYLVVILDPQRKPYVLMVQNPGKGQSTWLLGLVPANLFQGLLDRQKGQMSSVYLVNQAGQALGYSMAEYVGSMLNDDPIVAEIVRNGLASGSGIFKKSGGEQIQGLYEQVEGSNLYTVVTTPVQSLLKDRDMIRGQFVMMGLGLSLVGLAIFMLLFKDAPTAAPVASALPATPTPSVPVTNKPGAVQNNDRMAAYKQVASSLSHELKSPLTSILAHVRLVMDHVSGKDLDNLQQVQRQAEDARAMIQKLLIFTGEDQSEVKPTNLDGVVQKAIKSVEAKIISKGIRLSKKISQVPEFTMSSDLVSRAIENILLNAVEAMERAAQKELIVELKSEGSDIVLTISDTGEGISESDMGKIFDPFFTTRNNVQHVGLGLSTALGIVRETYGDIEVQSEKSKGTKVKITFRPQQQILAGAAMATAPAATAVAPVLSAPSAPAATVSEQELAVVDDVQAQTDLPPMDDDGKMVLKVSPLLVDNTIEKLIDGADLEDPLADRKIEKSEAKFPPSPAEALELSLQEDAGENEKTEILSEEQSQIILNEAQSSSSPGLQPSSNFSSKIDKPQIDLKKKSSRLDQMSVAIRRPGE